MPNRAGITPDAPPEAGLSAATAMDLPRRVMRRMAVVAAMSATLALAIGLAGADDDVEREVGAAMALAHAMERAVRSATLDDEALVAALHARADEAPLRHLTLTLRDADGRVRVGGRSEPAVPRWLESLAEAYRRWRPGPERPSVSWPLARPAGPSWSLTLAASPQGERLEAMEGLLLLAAALAAGTVAMLGVMAWHVRRALLPLQQLASAIERIRPDDSSAARNLPNLPERELQAVRQAVQTLAGALDDAAAEHRTLTRKMLSLQEDERARLARELHDEFGQRLTALRVDAHLLQRLAADGGCAQDTREAADRIATQVAGLQDDVRSLLHELSPVDAGDGGAARLHELLQSLVEGWQRTPGMTIALALDARWDPAARPGDLPVDRVRALYRMTQEALTNVVRHADATQATIELTQRGGLIAWTVNDDGVGVADTHAALLRGTGLAGLRERAWAQGGDLEIGATAADTARPGLRLHVSLPAPAHNAVA